MEQALHRSVSMVGCFHRGLGSFTAMVPSGLRIAPLGQTRPQTPHSVHRAGAIRCRSFGVPEIAPTGQFFAQSVQPTQASVMK